MSTVYDELNKIISEDEQEFWLHALSGTIASLEVDHDVCHQSVELLKVQKGLRKREDLEFEVKSCAITDLISPRQDKEEISLKSISNIKNINALSNNTELDFSKSGLTVIYGGNGSGKSGYVRILRNVCRFRGIAGKIIPNIYTDDGDECSAEIEYYKDQKEDDSQLLRFPEAENSVLKEISIFDSDSAIEYIEKKNKVAFRPFILNLLDVFTDVLDEIRHLIDTEIEYTTGRDFSEYFSRDGNKVRDYIGHLSKDSSKQELNNLVELDDDVNEIIAKKEAQLTEIKQKNVSQKVKRIEAKASRFTGIKKKLLLYKKALRRNKLNDLKSLSEKRTSAQEVAKVASELEFKNEPLKGVGSDVWLTLWEAARRYSEQEAYKGRDYPVTEEGAKCVLCQQDLSDEAKERYDNFDTFVKNQTQEELEELNALINVNSEELESFGFELTEIDETLQEIGIDAETSLEEILRDFLSNLNSRKTELLKSLNSNKNWDDMTSLPSFPLNEFNDLVSELEDRATALKELNTDEKIQELESELSLLKDKKKLKSLHDEVLKEIDRLNYIHGLEECLSELSTNRVTNVATNITEELVTEALKKSFQDEINGLGFSHFDVKLKRASVSKAVTYHSLMIEDAEGLPISNILSEGEYRCIALAHFFSEIQTSNNNSGVIFDDPVTSLDHRWTTKIAERLVNESKKRQVIVFTHDLTFLKRLVEKSEEMKAEISIRALDRRKIETGIVSESPPWESMTIKQRLKVLKQLYQDINQSNQFDLEETKEQKIRHFYGRLREAWEALIEELLLNKVVVRFGRAVQTQRLKRLTDITDDDIGKVDTAMSKCSKIFIGHDQATNFKEEVPNLSEIKDDLDLIDSYRVELQGKRKRS